MNQETVKARVQELIEDAIAIFNVFIDIDNVEVKFTLRGKTAGYCTTYKKERKMVLNFNTILMNENPTTFDNTIIHEVAHGVAYIVYANENITQHGKHWKWVMHKLGGNPTRCHSYSVETIKASKPYFLYRCTCSEFKMSPILHKRMSNGQKRYCQKCKTMVFHVVP